VSNQISWLCIGIASLRFRSAIRAQNLEHLLPYKNWTYPYGPLLAIILNSVLILVQGWKCFSPHFKAVDFVSFYIEIPVMIVMFLGWKLAKRTRLVHRGEMDLITDRYNLVESEGVHVGSSMVGLDHGVESGGGEGERKGFWGGVQEKSFLGWVKKVGMWLFL
ncbi:hypothetical protein BDV25DRAFT_145647, partial [Aspergillus avenaceus]